MLISTGVNRWTFANPSDPPFHSAGGYGSFPCDDCIPDPNVGAKFIRDLYEKAGDTNGVCIPICGDPVVHG